MPTALRMLSWSSAVRPSSKVAAQHDPAVDEQEHRRRPGAGKEGLDLFLEQHPGKPDGEGSGDQPPAQPLVGCAVHPTVDHAPRDTPRDGEPIPPEIDQQRRGGADVEQHHECQEGRVGLVDVPAKQLWQDHGMAQAAYGEELGDPLQQCQYEGLENRHCFL